MYVVVWRLVIEITSRIQLCRWLRNDAVKCGRNAERYDDGTRKTSRGRVSGEVVASRRPERRMCVRSDEQLGIQIQCPSTLAANAMQKDKTEIQNARTKTAHPVLSGC
jgi:hypothetical protein